MSAELALLNQIKNKKTSIVGELLEIANQDFFKTNAKYGYYPPNVEVDDSILTDESLEIVKKKLLNHKDLGDNWNAYTLSVFGESSIRSIAVDGNIVIATGVGGKVSRSEDGGETWSALISTPFDTSTINSVDISNGVAIAVSYGGKLCRSIDDGLTWHQIPTPFSTDDAFYSVSMDGNIAIAVGRRPAGTPIIYSSDSGATWSTAGNNPAAGVSIAITDVSVSGSKALLIYATSASISYDGGKTWSDALSVPSESSEYNCVGVDGNVAIIADSGGRIFRSVDGGENWEDGFSQPAGITVFRDVDIDNELVILTDSVGRVVKSNDWGTSWVLKSGISNGNGRSVSISGGLAFISGEDVGNAGSYALSSINVTEDDYVYITPDFPTNKAMKLELK